MNQYIDKNSGLIADAKNKIHSLKNKATLAVGKKMFNAYVEENADKHINNVLDSALKLAGPDKGASYDFIEVLSSDLDCARNIGKALVYVKTAGSVSTNTMPNLNPIREDNLKSYDGNTSKPPSGGSKGSYNVQPAQYNNVNKSGNSTNNDVESIVSSETTTPGPTGTTTNPSGIDSGLRHAHAVVYDHRASSTATNTNPTINKVQNGTQGAPSEDYAADNNYANTGQYGDKTTMNTVDFQTNSKVDKLTALSRKVNELLDKTAVASFDPTEDHFHRILRRKGEEALERGDKTAAIKCAVAMNALDAVDQIAGNAEREVSDKTAAKLPAGIMSNISKAGQFLNNIPRKAKSWYRWAGERGDILKQLDEKFSRAVPAKEIGADKNKYVNAANILGKPLRPDNANIIRNLGPVTPGKGDRLRYVQQLIHENPWSTNAGMALGAGTLAAGTAALLPTIDDPKNPLAKAYNSMVTHPIQTGLSVGLLAPAALTYGMNQSVTQPGTQAVQNLMGLGGLGGLVHNAARPDLEKGPDSVINEFTARTNRRVPNGAGRNVMIGTGLGGLGGLGAAALANKVGDLGFGIDDYMKYTAAGAALGGGMGALYNPLMINYDKDVNYLK